MAYSFQGKIAVCGITFTKTWHGVILNKEILLQSKSKQSKSRKKIDPYFCAIKAMVDIPPRLKTEISRHRFFFLKEENGKVDGCVYSTQYQPSLIPAFKSPNFITHQKMKDFMTNLYSFDCEAKAETDKDDDAEIHFMIANEGLDGDKEEDSEVVQPKVKRKPPKIYESSESDCEDSEVVEPTVKGKPHKGLDTMSVKTEI